jgi:hypothetical protein
MTGGKVSGNSLRPMTFGLEMVHDTLHRDLLLSKKLDS